MGQNHRAKNKLTHGGLMMKKTTQAILAHCPHCGSTFKATPAMLEQAFGAVRCGQCLKIFNAHYHQLHTPELNFSRQELDFFSPKASRHQESGLTKPPPQGGIWAVSMPDAAPLEAPRAQEPEPVSPDSSPYTQKYLHALKDFFTSRLQQGVLALLIILSLSIFFTAQTHWRTPDPYLVRHVQLIPHPQQNMISVQFELSNGGGRVLPVPSVRVELLNLSQQALSEQRILPEALAVDTPMLAPGAAHVVRVELQRPATFVHSARVHINP